MGHKSKRDNWVFGLKAFTIALWVLWGLVALVQWVIDVVTPPKPGVIDLGFPGSTFLCPVVALTLIASGVRWFLQKSND